MGKFLVILFGVMVVGMGVFFVVLSDTLPRNVTVYPKPRTTLWTFQSIDTMKRSRDLAREKLQDVSFDTEIDREIRDIAETGATHVAIATPYDEEFLPFLRRWVSAARRSHLHVWFRGNWSGWEGWFGYSKITRDEHLEKTRRFIAVHPDLFEDGDVFSACPECENGGSGDPRSTGDVSGYRKFLLDEYAMMKWSFASIRKDVVPGFFSMNGDVARLIMDSGTTAKTGGFITVDHYVKTGEMLEQDANDFISGSKGKLVLGEFGAPIPDIHGSMTEDEQAAWLEDVLLRFSKTPGIFGMNYWTNLGSSTALWNDSGKPRKAVSILARFYKPIVVYGAVTDELGRGVLNATVSIGSVSVTTRADGYFELRAPLSEDAAQTIRISADGYAVRELPREMSSMTIMLSREHEDWWFRFEKWMRNKASTK